MPSQGEDMPFDTGSPHESVRGYLRSRSVAELALEAATWAGDPAMFFTLAEAASAETVMHPHAQVLYLEGIRRAEAEGGDPSDLATAYAALGRLLAAAGRRGEAIVAYRKARDRGCRDPRVGLHLAVQLVATGRHADALAVLDELLEASDAEADVRSSVRKAAMELRMEVLGRMVLQTRVESPSAVDLEWWSGEELGPIPAAILFFPLSRLREHGIAAERLRALKLAVVVDVSGEGRDWYVALFEETDPWSALQSGGSGGFVVSYHLDRSRDHIERFDVVRR